MSLSDAYISPTLWFFPSFDAAFNDDPQKQQMRSFLGRFGDEDVFKSLLLFKRNFVIAEPGYGKTRLLEEVVRHAPAYGKEAIFIDLKKVGNEDFIEATKKQASIYNRKSPRFEFTNNEKTVFCFDALDEIQADAFSHIVEKLKLFVSEFSRASFIISCRRHHFEQQFNDLSFGNDFRFGRLFPFSIEQVSNYLITQGFSQNEVEQVVDRLSFQERDLVIQTPRYLELLVKFRKENPEADLQKVTKSSLLEYFIDKKLEHEDLKLNEQNRDLAKRLLESVALIMEIYQTNLLKKDELMSILGETNSNFPTIFLQQVPIKNLYHNSVLKSKPETIEFDNTEFQEYLAAKEIPRLGNSKRIAFDLFVDPVLREIRPSWFNVLQFLLEMDCSLLDSILEFGKSNKEKAVEDKEYHRLLLSVNVASLTSEEKKAVFEHIFIYHQDVAHWLDYDIAKKLAECFDLSQYKLLKRYIDRKLFKGNETKRWVNCANVASIVGYIIERNMLNESDLAFWKEKLVEFAKDDNENGVLQRNALFALAKLRDDSVIQELECVWKSDETLKNQFLDMCREINPNHDLSIKYFVEGAKQKSSIYARYGLYEIALPTSLKKLLEYFRDDQVFLKEFIDRESTYKDKDKRIVENIERAWNNDIEKIAKEVIFKAYVDHSFYWARESSFLLNLAFLLKKKNRDYLFELISQLNNSNQAWDNVFELTGLFAELLEVDQVEKFVHELEKIEAARFYGLRTLREIKFSKRADAGAVYEAGRQFFSEDYDKDERENRRRSTRTSDSEQLYHQFKMMLEPESGEYVDQVFAFYLQNKDSLKELIQLEELKRLEILITGSIFEKFDPGEQGLSITREDDLGRQYSIHPWITIFGDCIILANELNVDVKKYRTKILSYIPFAFSEHLNSIFALVKNITKAEIRDVFSVYKVRKGDLWKFMPENLIRASEQYHWREAAPILKEFVNETKFTPDIRVRALEAAEFLKPDSAFLKTIFASYIRSEPALRRIAITANSLLVENHEDNSAIKWRFRELKKRAEPVVKRKNFEVYYGSDELREKEFAAPVMKLKNPKHENQFLNLLKTSFAFVTKNGYYPYANYLWEIVCAYFYNRRTEDSYKPLEALEKFVEKHSTVEGINWFKYHLKRLKREYMLHVGKPSSISECIKKYNALKSQQFIEVSTPEELKDIVVEIIDSDLRKWVESEGAYSFMKTQRTPRQEDLIQKTLLTQLENAFLRRGFKDVDIVREPQLLDNKRVDFRLVSYGFTGPILIELKLSKHQDLNGTGLRKKKSYESFCQYMKGYNAHFGIFLVFDNKARTKRSLTWKQHLSRIKRAYKMIENVVVLDLKC